MNLLAQRHAIDKLPLLKFWELKYFYYYFELLAGIERYKGAGFEQALNRYILAPLEASSSTYQEFY